jgi:mannose-1-phosphate guanylyltransferase/mannose-6-phosphate isomerase
MADIWPVILSGGSGERLWPLSRKLYPKQFQALTGDLSLFQECAMRVGPNFGYRHPVIVCNDDHRFIAAEQLRLIGIDPATILLEPVSRNTAPAIAAAATWITQADTDAVMAVFPSDHMIPDGAALRKALGQAAVLAAQGSIVALCVEPDSAHTGYGYIECGEATDDSGSTFPIRRFTEKPNHETAQKFFRQGDYLWNAGIFLFGARSLRKELERFEADIIPGVEEAVTSAERDLDFLRLDMDAFATCPSISIDFAVMERTDKAMAVVLEAGWHDVGSWNALWDVSLKDASNNVTIGDVVLEDVRNSYVRAEAGLVAATGVDGLVIVVTKDATYISRKDNEDAARVVVSILKEKDRDELNTHTRQYRPWGFFENLGDGPGFQVKHLCLNPGAKISLQKHSHRSEHWVTVSGNASVTCDGREFTLKENESTYIPLGAVHRLENSSAEPISIVEVQTGDELCEDDIERFEDLYQRD